MQEPETKVKEKDRRADRSAYMDKETVIVLDFGGQYNQLIARRVRECHVYCEVHPCTAGLEQIKAMNPKGIIFTGGPNSVYGEDSPRYTKEIFDLGIPILGICYGSQLMAYLLGGSVKTATGQRIWQDRGGGGQVFRSFWRCVRKDNLLDEPYGLYRKRA